MPLLSPRLPTVLRRGSVLLLLAMAMTVGACGDRPASSSGMPPLREMDEVAFGVSMLRLDAEDKRGALGNEKLLREAYEELRAGKPFAEVAATYSDDRTKGDGGFMGFVNVRGGETAFAGAVQATPPGRFSLPFATKLGPTIIYRHPFDEALELERRHAVPVLGFPLPYGAQGHRDQRMASSAAQEAVAKIRAGELTLGEARQRYAGDDNRRPGDEFLGAFRKHTSSPTFWDTIRQLKPGELAPAFGDDRAWYVVQRAEPLMALVRHIFIGHAKYSETLARTPQDAHKLAEEVLARVLEDRSVWDREVTAHSDDAPSRPNRGTLPLLSPGTSDPEFEAAVRAAEPGTIVPRVVDTPHGSHVIWRVR